MNDSIQIDHFIFSLKSPAGGWLLNPALFLLAMGVVLWLLRPLVARGDGGRPWRGLTHGCFYSGALVLLMVAVTGLRVSDAREAPASAQKMPAVSYEVLDSQEDDVENCELPEPHVSDHGEPGPGDDL